MVKKIGEIDFDELSKKADYKDYKEIRESAIYVQPIDKTKWRDPKYLKNLEENRIELIRKFHGMQFLFETIIEYEIRGKHDNFKIFTSKEKVPNSRIFFDTTDGNITKRTKFDKITRTDPND
ncbi:MAG TPA: hypothetical protein VJJ25_01265 [Nitrosopumilaceae archaeon]|nr:hypothetical protein [Nitrosopumilaceae archaeon]